MGTKESRGRDQGHLGIFDMNNNKSLALFVPTQGAGWVAFLPFLLPWLLLLLLLISCC